MSEGFLTDRRTSKSVVILLLPIRIAPRRESPFLPSRVLSFLVDLSERSTADENSRERITRVILNRPTDGVHICPPTLAIFKSERDTTRVILRCWMTLVIIFKRRVTIIKSERVQKITRARTFARCSRRNELPARQNTRRK